MCSIVAMVSMSFERVAHGSSVFGSAQWHFVVVRHVLVGITKLGQVSESGFGIQKAQHRVITWILLELGDRAFGIQHVPKGNGSCRASLLTGGLYRPIRHFDIARISGSHLLGNLGGLDALSAESAFFHHTTHANRDIRVLGHFHQVDLIF